MKHLPDLLEMQEHAEIDLQHKADIQFAAPASYPLLWIPTAISTYSFTTRYKARTGFDRENVDETPEHDANVAEEEVRLIRFDG